MEKGLTELTTKRPDTELAHLAWCIIVAVKLARKEGKSLTPLQTIIIIGYSFPRTDLKSNQLFVDAFMNRRDIPYVTILDPQPEKVADKFRYELGIPDTHLRVFKDYFSEDTDFSQLLEFSK